MKKIKDLPQQVINAIADYVDQGFFGDNEWESFMNDTLENVKEFSIKSNDDTDLFNVFNGTDGFYASPEDFPFDKAIEFITAFPERYESQGGKYRTSGGELIDATKATFIISKNLPSPMGGFLSGVSSKEEAETLQKEKEGTLYSWNELLTHYKNK